MNLHWGGTLGHKGFAKAKTKDKRNLTIPFPYYYTEYKLSKEKHYWDDFFARNRTANNHSALYANNNFMRKSSMLSDMKDPKVKSQSFTTVVVIASIFLFFTLSITVAVVVFCRKKNSVFALQQSEQEDAEMEMDEFNSDVEVTDTEFESEMDIVRHRRLSLNHLDPGGADLEDTPIKKPSCKMRLDDRGAYQKMVVTALLDRPNHTSDSEDSGTEARLQYQKPLNKKYYGIAAMSSDIDSDEGMSLCDKTVINATYAVEELPQDHQVLSYKDKSSSITASLGRHKTKPAKHRDSNANRSLTQACMLYVNLPADEKDMPEPGSVICVKMPAKEPFRKDRKHPMYSSLDGLADSPPPQHMSRAVLAKNNQSATPIPSPTPTQLLQSPQNTCYPFGPLRPDPDIHFDLESPTDTSQKSQQTSYRSMKPVKSLPEGISMVAHNVPQSYRPPRSESSLSLFFHPGNDMSGSGYSKNSNRTTQSPAQPSTSVLLSQSPPMKDIACMFRVSNTRSKGKVGCSGPPTRKSAPKPRTLDSAYQLKKDQKLPLCVFQGLGMEGFNSSQPAAPAPSPATPMEENFVLNMDGGDYCSDSEVLVSKDTLSLTR